MKIPDFLWTSIDRNAHDNDVEVASRLGIPSISRVLICIVPVAYILHNAYVRRTSAESLETVWLLREYAITICNIFFAIRSWYNEMSYSECNFEWNFNGTSEIVS